MSAVMGSSVFQGGQVFDATGLTTAQAADLARVRIAVERATAAGRAVRGLRGSQIITVTPDGREFPINIGSLAPSLVQRALSTSSRAPTASERATIQQSRSAAMSLQLQQSRQVAQVSPLSIGGLIGTIGRVAGGVAGGIASGGPIGGVVGGLGALAGGSLSGGPGGTSGGGGALLARGFAGGNCPQGMVRVGTQCLPAPPGGTITDQRGVFMGPIGVGGRTVTTIPAPAGPPQASIGCPSGFHPNKTSYFLKDGTFVPEGTKCVKNRRRNPLNPRALDRAISRISSAKRASKKISRVTVRKASC